MSTNITENQSGISSSLGGDDLGFDDKIDIDDDSDDNDASSEGTLQ